MDQFQRQFEENPVKKTLQDAIDAVTAIEKVGGLPVEPQAYLTKIHAILDEASHRLSLANPYLVNIAGLTNLNNHAQNVLNELRNYESNKNVGHLSNALSYSDGVMAQLQPIPSPRSKKDLDAAAEAARRFRLQLQREAAEFAAVVQRARNDSNVATLEIERMKEALTVEQQKVASLLATVKGNVETEAARQKGEFETQLQGFRNDQQAFLAKQDKQVAEKNAAADRIENDRQLKLKEETSRFEGELQERLAKAQTYLLERKEAVEKLVQATGSATLTGDHQKRSKTAGASARRWRNATVGILAALSLFALAMFGSHLFGSKTITDWSDTAARVSILVPFLALAGYTARQAARYHDIEEEHGRISIELSSFEPYLALLDETARSELRKQLAPRFFKGATTERKDRGEGRMGVTDTVKDVIGR